MTTEQQQKMLTTQRLILGRKRLFKHYEVLIWLGLPMCFCVAAFVYMQSQDSLANIVGPKLILLGLPGMGLLIFLNQYRALGLKKMDTSLSKEKNYTLAKEVITELKWRLQVDSKGFLEAFNPFSDLRTWGDEMISIVIDDQQMLITSICNVDQGRSQAALSFGKNRQNIRRFGKMFTTLAQGDK